MLDTPETSRLFLALSVCLGLIVAGGGNALLGARRFGRLLVAGVGVAVAAGTAQAFQSPWTVPVLVAGLGGVALIAVAGSRVARQAGGAITAAFRSPRARWGAVAAVGLGGLGYELDRYERADAAQIDGLMDDFAFTSVSLEGTPVAGVELRTDRGHRVTPVSADNAVVADELRKREQRSLGDHHLRSVIARRPPSAACNCHGWVFTGGRYGIRGRDVGPILADNGYREVTAPAVDDVCVYRSSDGAVTHTALVRAVLTDGTVLVESKWGWLGVYLHPVEESCYGKDFKYYHTARATHLLAEATSPVPTAPDSP